MQIHKRACFYEIMGMVILCTLGAFAVFLYPGMAQASGAGRNESIEIRLHHLEDREEIRQLLVDYGRTLDQRDFVGFSMLFAENAEYGSGAGTEVTKGRAAIGKLLEDIFRKNPTGLRSPNFHLFANVSIELKGDEAVATSKGIFVVPGELDKPEMVMLATYNDLLVRENGRWKFKRRIVHSDIPSVR